MDIGHAIAVLRVGKRVARRGWNGKSMWLELQTPTSTSKMTLPYVFIKTVDNNLVPWLASQTDLLADDYYIVEDGFSSTPIYRAKKEIATGAIDCNSTKSSLRTTSTDILN